MAIVIRARSAARMIAHPIRAFRHRGCDPRVEVSRTGDGKIRILSSNGEVVYLPAAAISTEAPVAVQRTALRVFTKLTAAQIASVGDRFEDLRAVVELIWMSDTCEPGLIGSWLRSRNRGLAYVSPLAAIRAGHVEDVIFCAESFVAWSPAPYPDKKRETAILSAVAAQEGSGA